MYVIYIIPIPAYTADRKINPGDGTEEELLANKNVETIIQRTIINTINLAALGKVHLRNERTPSARKYALKIRNTDSNDPKILNPNPHKFKAANTRFTRYKNHDITQNLR